MILYHPRNRRRSHSSSGMTAGRQGLLGMGAAAASAGAAGPSQGLRAGWSSGRTEAGVHRGERTTHLRERTDDRDSEPDYLLRPTRHGPGSYNSGKDSFYLTANAQTFGGWRISNILASFLATEDS